MGIRIYQLAKELNTESKTILNLAKTKGIELTSHMASIDEDIAQVLREDLANNDDGSKTPKKNNKKGKSKGEVKEPDSTKKVKTKEKEKEQTRKKIDKVEKIEKTEKAEKIEKIEKKEEPKNSNPAAQAESAKSHKTHKKDTLRKSGKEEYSASKSATPATTANSKSKGNKENLNQTKEKPKQQHHHHHTSKNERSERYDRQDKNNNNSNSNNDNKSRGGYKKQGHQSSTKSHQSHSGSSQQNNYTGTTTRRSQNPAHQTNRYSQGRSSFRSPNDHRQTDRYNRRHGGRDRHRKGHTQKHSNTQPIQPSHQRDKKVEVTIPITLKDLSQLTGLKSTYLITLLMKSGVMVAINDVLDKEQVELIGLESGWEFIIKEQKDVEEVVDSLYTQTTDPENLTERAPVVTMMGHVDHGKTTLLDKIRDTDVAAGESGGITQHIKAHKIAHNGKPIVFLDTPGHEAFTKMRARGANVTDIVVLVVAADDGVMPTTEEAISHAKAADVKIIVAINKVDLPDANPQRTQQQLADKGILSEDWGGEVGFVEVSAKTGQGIDDLLERILLEAEMMELRADANRPACGHVLEAKKDSDKGIMVDILVQEGELKKGDYILIGNSYGKVKSITDHFGKFTDNVGPSTPVQIAGVDNVPRAGDRFLVMSSLEEIKKIIDERRRKTQQTKWNTRKVSPTNLADFLKSKKGGETKYLRLIIKGDTQGSLEVLSKSFLDLSSDEVKVEIIHSAVGGIIESDVDLADASDAVIIGFRVICDDPAYQLARHRKIDIHIYQVIYKAIDELKNILIGMYDPEEREESTAELEVLKTFKISRFGTIAGCRVKKGTIERKNRVRLARNNIIIYDGKLASLKHFQDDVPSVKSGFECGVKLENYDDVKPGDRILSYKIEKHKRNITL